MGLGLLCLLNLLMLLSLDNKRNNKRLELLGLDDRRGDGMLKLLGLLGLLRFNNGIGGARLDLLGVYGWCFGPSGSESSSSSDQADGNGAVPDVHSVETAQS